MGVRTVLLVVAFVVSLVAGCAPITTVRHSGSPRLLRPAQGQETARPQSLKGADPDPAVAVPIRRSHVQGEYVPLPTSFDSELKNSERVALFKDNETSSGTNESEHREQSGHSQPESRKGVSPPTYWPHADDRLLDLVQKDLDKAVDQRNERRRLQFSKAVVDNPRVRYYLNQFSKAQKDYLVKTLERSGKYFQMISNVLHEEGLPEELAYLALVESNFYPAATSKSGAVGLWQFVPSTAREYGLKIDRWIDERRDPVKSTRAAAAYLKHLHEYFGRWYLATAAYNAGPGAIDRALQKSGAKDYWSLSQKSHLSEETRNFVPKFVAVTLIATNPEKYGFADLVYEVPTEYEEFEIHRPLSLQSVAAMADTDIEMIRELNPALLRNSTPPDQTNFRLRLPADKTVVFARAYEQKEKETEQTQVVTHKVQKGETLFSIARRYGQEVRALMRLNGLSTPRLTVGQRLMIIVEKLRGGLR